MPLINIIISMPACCKKEESYSILVVQYGMYVQYNILSAEISIWGTSNTTSTHTTCKLGIFKIHRIQSNIYLSALHSHLNWQGHVLQLRLSLLNFSKTKLVLSLYPCALSVI